MPQEQASDLRQLQPSNATGATQQLPFVAPTPNMLPFSSAEATRESVTTGSRFYPIALPSYTSFLGNSVGNAPFPDLAYPFPSQYTTMPLQRHETGDPVHGAVDMVQPGKALRNSFHSNGPSLSPATFTQPSNKRSRLPTNNAPRKAPRKAAYIDNSGPQQRIQPRPLKVKKKGVRERPGKQADQSRDDSPA